MKKEIFEYTDYKSYLKDFIQQLPRGGRGFKSDLAKAMNCHSGYVSQVLGGKADFSLEQGQAINQLLGHAPEESHFFMNLIQWQRAGTKDLQAYFRAQIDDILNRRKDLQNRLQAKKALSGDENISYFGHWHFAATHALLSIPGGKSLENVTQFLGCSVDRATKVLSFLTDVGLAKLEDGRYVAGTTRIHLGADSPLISQHHTNWRMQAIHALSRASLDDLHYSSVISIAEKDVPKIREIMVAAIEKVRAVVRDSPEEGVFCYLLDLFPVAEIKKTQ